MKYIVLTIFLSINVHAAEIKSLHVVADLSSIKDVDADYWRGIKEETISLMAQPMLSPRPKVTTTETLLVQSVNNGKWIAFRLKWKDKEKSEAGKLGEFSDGIALQFPVKDNNSPPPINMGTLGDPVHIFHWRAQYQRDLEKGKPEMKDIYPNMNADMYPMEFKDQGNLKNLTEEKREAYAYGKAAGNPQAFSKHGIDEIKAEGFSTSAVLENVESVAKGLWRNGEWTVVIARALKREGGSTLEVGKGSFLAFGVWQGGQDEVGSRKSITMEWTPLKVEEK